MEKFLIAYSPIWYLFQALKNIVRSPILELFVQQYFWVDNRAMINILPCKLIERHAQLLRYVVPYEGEYGSSYGRKSDIQ